MRRGGELVPAPQGKPGEDQDHRDQRQQLERGRNQLEPPRRARTAQVEQGDEPDQHGRHDRAVQRRVGERWHEHREVARRGQRDDRIGRPHPDPIAPAEQQPRQRPQRRAADRDHAARLGPRGGELGQHPAEQQRAARSPQPCHRAGRSERRELRGQHEDARSDHPADDQRRRHPEAERPRLRIAALSSSPCSLARSEARIAPGD